MPDDSRMNVLVSVSDAYVMPLSVMLTSLLATNEPHDLVIWLLRTGLSDGALESLRMLVEGQGARLECLEMDGSFFDGYPTASYIASETYLRLLSGEVLPAEVHLVLWLDADLVVRRSLRQLYETDFSGNALVACSHAGDTSRGLSSHCEAIGIDIDEYVNAGVMLINLDDWRGRDLRGDILRVVGSGMPLRYADQDLVNVIFRGRIVLADPEVYNFRTNRRLSEGDMRLGREHAAIIHYCGTPKPWMFSDIPLGDIWRAWYDKSPYRAHELRLISRTGLSRLVWKAKGEVADE